MQFGPVDFGVALNLALAYYKLGDLDQAAEELTALRADQAANLQIILLLADDAKRHHRPVWWSFPKASVMDAKRSFVSNVKPMAADKASVMACKLLLASNAAEFALARSSVIFRRLPLAPYWKDSAELSGCVMRLSLLAESYANFVVSREGS